MQGILKVLTSETVVHIILKLLQKQANVFLCLHNSRCVLNTECGLCISFLLDCMWNYKLSLGIALAVAVDFSCIVQGDTGTPQVKLH
jgi:hypothetical protein